MPAPRCKALSESFSRGNFSLMCLMCPCRHPGTFGKTIELVEEAFSDGEPKPWLTQPGESKLDSRIQEARERNLYVKDVGDPAEQRQLQWVRRPSPRRRLHL